MERSSTARLFLDKFVRWTQCDRHPGFLGKLLWIFIGFVIVYSIFISLPFLSQEWPKSRFKKKSKFWLVKCWKTNSSIGKFCWRALLYLVCVQPSLSYSNTSHAVTGFECLSSVCWCWTPCQYMLQINFNIPKCYTIYAGNIFVFNSWKRTTDKRDFGPLLGITVCSIG